MKYLRLSPLVALFGSALLFAMVGCDDDKSSANEAPGSHEGHDHDSESGHHGTMMDESHTDSGEHHMDSGEHHMDSGEHHMESESHHTAEPETKKPDDARLITIKATDYEFSPATITAEPGEKLYIKLVNEGKFVHMWQLRGRPATHIHTPVGDTSAQVVTAPENPGEYEFFCGTPGHEERGMVGTLKVSADDHSGHSH